MYCLCLIAMGRNPIDWNSAMAMRRITTPLWNVLIEMIAKRIVISEKPRTEPMMACEVSMSKFYVVYHSFGDKIAIQRI